MSRLFELTVSRHRRTVVSADLEQLIHAASAAVPLLRALPTGPGLSFDTEAVEVMVLLLLNTKHRLIGYHVMSRGSAEGCLCSPADVYRVALLAGATGVILAHNHPSGDPTPSPDDHAVTRRVAAAGAVFGVPLLDHIILGHERYVSFQETGLLTEGRHDARVA